MNRNYQKELEKLMTENEKLGRRPRLLLHVCCAPCSSYCLEYLDTHFELVLNYYNPNISPKEEYDKRVNELRRLLGKMPLKYPVSLDIGVYEPELFLRWQKDWRKNRKEEKGVLPAMRCGFGKRQRRPDGWTVIISPQPFPLVHIKMPAS